MDCEHARLLLTFARDRAALDPDEADGLDEHLRHCRDCAAAAAGEQRFDTALGQAMRDVPVPAGLKTRLLARLSRPRLLRRWILSSAAAAAVLLLAVGLAWRLWLAPRTEIAFDNVPVLVCHVDKVSAQRVEEWFRNEHGLEMTFPPRWDAQKLESCSVGFFQGQRVPKLEFLVNNHLVHVYVLSDQKFEISADTDVPSHVRISPSQSMGAINTKNGYLYLVVYTGTGDGLPAFQ